MSSEVSATLERLCSAVQESRVGLGPQEDTSLYPVLAGLNDLDMIPGELGAQSDGNGLVTMKDADELFLALQLASNELGYYNDGPTIIEKVGHEYQHAKAARALGLTAIHAIKFKQLENNSIGMKTTTMPVGGPISKLAFASIIAYPRRLSRSDERKLQSIGYDSISDLVFRITESGLAIPIPMSARK